MKILLIGIDGGTWKIYDRLLEENRVPFLKSLVEDGTKGILNSTIPPITAPAWASFQTGVNPGKHGVYDFIGIDLTKMKTFIVSSRSIKTPRLWEMVAKNNGLAITVNVPLTYPPKKIDGWITVGGMLSPKVSPDFVYPKEVFDRVISQVPEYQILVPRWSVESFDLPSFIDEQTKVEGARFKVGSLLNQLYPDWSVFMLHVQSSDVIQHTYWHYIDPSHPMFDREFWYEIVRFYESIDKMISDFVESLKPDYVIIVSDHGFGPSYREVNLNLYLKKVGLLKTTKTLYSALMEDFLRRYDRWNLVKRAVVKVLGHNAARKWRQKRSGQILSLIDWEKTKCFVTASIHYASVFWNPEYKNHEDITVFTNAVSNLKDGDRLVTKKIYTKEELYGKNPKGYPPDFVVEPIDGYVFQQSLFALGIFRDYRPGLEDTGGHDRKGIIVVYPKINGFEEADITDVSPTVLNLLNLPIPKNIDGKSLTPR